MLYAAQQVKQNLMPCGVGRANYHALLACDNPVAARCDPAAPDPEPTVSSSTDSARSQALPLSPRRLLLRPRKTIDIEASRPRCCWRGAKVRQQLVLPQVIVGKIADIRAKHPPVVSSVMPHCLDYKGQRQGKLPCLRSATSKNQPPADMGRRRRQRLH